MVQYQRELDRSFAALADPTRRAVLARLGRGNASVGELAEPHGMTLTGMRKHVGVLESAGLIQTRKVGRRRVCSLGPRRLDDAADWIAAYQRGLSDRLDRLDAYLSNQQGDER